MATVVFLLVSAFAAPTFAALDDTPTVTSVTNPHLWITQDPSSHVPDNLFEDNSRQGWGNSFWPDMTFGPDDDFKWGYYYAVVRPGLNPWLDDTSLLRQGSMMDGTYDMLGIYAGLSSWERDFVADRPGQIPHNPLEGRWNLHMRYYGLGPTGASELATRTWTVDFGIDVTPPRAINNIRAKTIGPINLGDNGATEINRRRISWDISGYDDMSGVVRYHIYKNGIAFMRVDTTRTVGSADFTWENVPVGTTRLSVRAEDRAGNLSPMAYAPAPIIVDPDVPVVSIKSPGAYQSLRGIQTLEATATDAACSPRVLIRIDGRVWRDIRRAPYKMSFDTRWLSNGYHTMEVTAKDLFGHTKTATRVFHVDNTPMTISSISDYPDPFYPYLRDGYKDDVTIKFTLSEVAADVRVDLYQIVDETRHHIGYWHGTNVASGRQWISWDGKGADDTLGVGAYRRDGKNNPESALFIYMITAKDRAGNVTKTPFNSVTYRNFEVVRSSSGTIRIVPR